MTKTNFLGLIMLIGGIAVCLMIISLVIGSVKAFAIFGITVLLAALLAIGNKLTTINHIK
jgi:hypothetical protein